MTQLVARNRFSRMITRITFASAIAAVTLLGARTARAQEGGIAVGAMAPAAEVYTLDGAPTNLSSYIGKQPVVLEFWATWCPLCKQLEPAMAAAREHYAKQVRFVSVGVPNNQSPEKQKAFVAERRIGGEFVFDRDSKAIQAFKVPHTSYVVVLDKTGKVVYTGVGGEQDLMAAIAKGLDKNAMGGTQ